MDGRNETEKMDSDFAAESFYVMMTDHKAKANLEKGSSWPPEAISYGVPLSRASEIFGKFWVQCAFFYLV